VADDRDRPVEQGRAIPANQPRNLLCGSRFVLVSLDPILGRVNSMNPYPISPLLSPASTRYVYYGRGTAAPESNSVARTCTICIHQKLLSIDRQLLRGDMLNGIAHRFHVSPDAVGRHRRHMRAAMLKAQAAAEKPDLIYGQTLIDEVKAIKADAERLQLEAEGRQDIRAALQAVRERVSIIELQAKLMGEIQTGNRSVTFNVQTISPEEAVGYANDILALFGTAPTSQPELGAPLAEGEADISAMELNNGN